MILRIKPLRLIDLFDSRLSLKVKKINELFLISNDIFAETFWVISQQVNLLIDLKK